MVIYIGYDPATGRPLGAAETDGHWPDFDVIQAERDRVPTLAELKTLWVEDGVLVDRTGQDLAEVQSAAKAKVDAQAEILRLQMLTPGEGQAQTYALKIEELAAYDAVIAAGGTPDAAEDTDAVASVVDGITWPSLV